MLLVVAQQWAQPLLHDRAGVGEVGDSGPGRRHAIPDEWLPGALRDPIAQADSRSASWPRATRPSGRLTPTRPPRPRESASRAERGVVPWEEDVGDRGPDRYRVGGRAGARGETWSSATRSGSGELAATSTQWDTSRSRAASSRRVRCSSLRPGDDADGEGQRGATVMVEGLMGVP